MKLIFLRILLFSTIATVSCGCADSRIAVVKKFRALRDAGDLNAARELVDPNARVWFENPVGPGSQWKIGKGKWAAWDEYFHSTNTLIGHYQLDGDWVFGLFHEDNDYYRLTERTWSRVMYAWRVNDKSQIDGMLVAGVGKSANRFDEFKEWALEHDPDEFEYLMPNGRIDPTGDRPQRFRAILNRWRADIGLPEIH